MEYFECMYCGKRHLAKENMMMVSIEKNCSKSPNKQCEWIRVAFYKCKLCGNIVKINKSNGNIIEVLKDDADGVHRPSKDTICHESPSKIHKFY